MFFFINHTKKSIKLTTKDANKNISSALCIIIKENKWSICDNIEFLDYFHLKKRETIIKLIESDYSCSLDDASWFYF